MSLTDDFNIANEAASPGDAMSFKSYNSGTTLSLYQSSYGKTLYTSFHFLTRTMTCASGSSDGGVTVVPFAQLDREVLEFMREKLIELGGKPPALPVLDKPGSIFPSKGL